MKNKEKLEEAIKREYEARKFNSDFPFDPQSFKLGAKWEAKRRYSEEDMQEYAKFCIRCHEKGLPLLFAKDYFEISINNNGL